MSKARSKKGLFSTGMLNDEPDSLQGYYAGFTSRAVAIIIDYGDHYCDQCRRHRRPCHFF